MKRFTDEGRILVCFDFDETYFPHACSDEQLASIRRLEDFFGTTFVKRVDDVGDG
jgi:kanosamine-6-phosphate phosphatase